MPTLPSDELWKSSLELLPEELKIRAERLQPYYKRHGTCPRCIEAREKLTLAFDAAYAGDLSAAAAMLDAAEAADRAPHDCGRNAAPRAGITSRMHDQVPGFVGRGPLVAATDAAMKRNGTGGMGYVVSDGRWGMRSWVTMPRRGLTDPSGPSRVAVAELRAVDLLLCQIGEDANGLLLLTDSTHGLSYLQRWQRGDVDHMPPGYSLRPRTQATEPTLVRLARIVSQLPRLRVEHVQGHRAHPLNEAADALAGIAARRAEDARPRAADLVTAFLRDWHSAAAS
ncbi:RNase H family protein [Microbispora sp. NBRC 16548]|uniref:RNase H family protein n=1 Tax=Microbispora sp. NBRC 16548 TaxID=3030994 RepID=UPI0025531F73|nr:RNase H family protein [Microbispora sp. NBRC 16548]